MAKITKESMDMVYRLANKFAYGNTRSIAYEEYVNVGIEGMQKAVDTFKEGTDATFSTYCYRCILNAMVNEQKRKALHDLAEDDQQNENLEAWNGECDHIIEEKMEVKVKTLIRRAVKSERNARIVELHIGLEDEPMELKDIAKLFNLTHESVRLICKNGINNIRKDKSSKELFSYVG